MNLFAPFKKSSGIDAIIRAVYRKEFTALRSLVPSGKLGGMADPAGTTPLMHALLDTEPSLPMITCLIDLGSDLDAHEKTQQWTALHVAARDHKPEVLELLLSRGAKVDPVDVYGNTPLWRAVMAYSGSTANISVLLKYRADPNKKNLSDVSAVDLARNRGKPELVPVLESRGA